MFGVTILGNNSAIPAYDRHPTAQIVVLDNHDLLIDCGEGTQMQLSKYKIRRSKIHYIFISHLHGDHYFGLIGLINSFGLLGRTTDLHLFAPAPLEAILHTQLTAGATTLPFHLIFHPLEKEGCILQETKFTVETFKVNHRIECWGFIVREKKEPRKIDRDKVIEYSIPSYFYPNLKHGEDYITKDGTIIANEVLTIPNTPARSYAYCADTLYTPALAQVVKNVSLLYHETTYLKEFSERAAIRFHSTTEQAAQLAKDANVGKLLIGHFSSKFERLDDFLKEASYIFPQTQLALEGVTFIINNQ